MHSVGHAAERSNGCDGHCHLSRGTDPKKKSFVAMTSGLENYIDVMRSQWVLLTALKEEVFFEKKINGLVLIDSYALINRLGFGEARSDLCNGCLQKIENA